MDFMFRKTSGVHLAPQNRGEIDDHIFSPMMGLQAGHQIFLDISRLYLVSAPSFSKNIPYFKNYKSTISVVDGVMLPPL